MRGIVRSIAAVLLGRRVVAFADAGREERRVDLDVQPAAVSEAQWNVAELDWPLPHPDDPADEKGFQELCSRRYLAAAAGLDRSLRRQLLAREPVPVPDPGGPARRGGRTGRLRALLNRY